MTWIKPCGGISGKAGFPPLEPSRQRNPAAVMCHTYRRIVDVDLVKIIEASPGRRSTDPFAIALLELSQLTMRGNLPALEAVLADIDQRAIDLTIDLGDCVSGPLWPREVCHVLMASDDLTIRGNHDRWVSGRDPAWMGKSDQHAHSDSTRIIAVGWEPCQLPQM